MIDNAYDNALRNAIPNELYDADSANLHLLGIGMDNVHADGAFEAQRSSEYRQECMEIFGFVP